MRILIPVPATEVLIDFASPEVAVSEYPAWDSATAYTIEQRVHKVEGNRAYDYQAVEGNTNTDPTVNHLTVNPKWVKVGLSNRYKVIDRVIGDPAVATSGTMVYRFEMTQNVTSVALFGVVGQTVQVSVEAKSGSTYSVIPGSQQTKEIANSPYVSNWFEYFFGEFTITPDMVFSGLPGYKGNFLRIEVTSSEDVKIGEVVYGREVDIGTTLEDPSLRIVDYSRKERDEFGRPKIVERPSSITGEFDIAYPTARTRSLLTQLSEIRAVPAVFYVPDVDEGVGALIFGYFTDFSMNLKVGEESYSTLTVEGLI